MPISDFKIAYKFTYLNERGIFFPALLFLLFFSDPSLPFYNQKNNINFTVLTNEDGLSHNSVTSILQDKKGFLWFGTYNGLNKYDGYNFKFFLPNSKNSNSIAGQSILSVYEDKKGFLWIGTNKGLSQYNPETDKFTNFRHDKNEAKSLSHSIVFTTYEDHNGNIWVGTLSGLDKYDPKTNSFIKIKDLAEAKKTKGFAAVTCISEDHSGNLWVGTWQGITCIKPDGSKKYIALPRNGITIKMNSEVCSIVEDHENNLWFGTRLRGVFKYITSTGTFVHYTKSSNSQNSLAGNSVRCLFRDSYNNLWIGTQTGLSKYDFVLNTFTNFFNDPEKPLSISSNNIRSIAEDRTGIIWLGTNEGINRFYQLQSPFEFLQVSTDPDNRIYSVIKDSYDNLWIGGRKGIYKKAPGTDEVARINSVSKGSNSFVFQITFDKEGLLWIGSSLGGLTRFNPLNGETLSYKYNTRSKNSALSFSTDKAGNIWIGTWKGIEKLDIKAGTFTTVKEIKNNVAWKVLCDSKGSIWVTSSENGLYNYNPKTQKTIHFSAESTAKYKILSNRVITLLESHDGIIWIGTTDGLCSYNRKTGVIKSYGIADGLIHDLINSLIEDKNGNIWIGTDKGLSKLNRKTFSFRNYGKRDGIPDISFSPNAVFKDKNGVLYFGTLHGIVHFNPEDINSNGFNVPIIFTDLKYNGRSLNYSGSPDPLLEKYLPFTNHVTLPYSNGIVAIDFALMDYVNTRNNRFSYKLTGLDSDWNNIGNRNSATYTNLPPGEYRLLVKAHNDNGWVANTASLKITIIPSFYQTTGFKVFLSVLFILFIVFVINFRTKTIKRQNLLLEQKVNEHTRYLDRIITDLSQEITERKKAESKVKASLDEKEILLKEIHHRVKNNLQIISSLLYLQSTKAKDKETLSLFEDSQSRIKSMALIHEKLYQSKDFAGINFSEYVNGLVGFLNNSLKNSVNIKTNIDIQNINLDLDTAISCGLIINELVTNSYKYAFPPDFVNDKKTEECTVDISIVKNIEGTYLLTIRDNGVGISADMNIKKAETLGLKLVYSMVKQLDGSIEIKSDKGTIFRICFT